MSNLSKSKTSLFVNIRVLCTVALLTACATAIAYICKSFTITPYLRVTFENLPLILAGYLFGPWAGLAAGLASDFLNTAVTYGLGQLNPIITLGAGVVGFTAGAVSRWFLPGKGTGTACCQCGRCARYGEYDCKIYRTDDLFQLFISFGTASCSFVYLYWNG